MTRLHQIRSQRLLRHFFHSFFDNEIIAPAGEAHQTFVSAAALLGGLGFTLSLIFALRYGIGLTGASAAYRQWAAVSDNLIVVLLTMALMGLLTVLAWDSLLPTRRDAHILSAFPLRPSAIFRARLFATLLFFALTLTALAILPLLALPICQTPAGDWTQLARRFAAQLTAVCASAAFVFFSALLLQALLLALLPYARFLQFSSLLQILYLLSSFALFFLTPNPADAVRARLHWALYLPPYWFLDLWQSLAGGFWPFPRHTAALALPAAASVVTLSLALFAALYSRALRKAVEGLPLSPSGPSFFTRALAAALDNTFLRDPRQRAVFWFAVRTLFRHRNHRLLLALYFSLGLAWVLAGVSSAFSTGFSRLTLAPDPVTCTIPLSIAAILLIGMRALFSLPVEPRANWLFRTTAPLSDPAIPRAVRKLLIAIGVVPMALAPFPLYFAAWGPRAALAHSLLFLLECAILLEFVTWRFTKIPFTCSWLPGQANLKVKLGVYFIEFGAAMSFLGSLESFALTRPTLSAFVKLSLFLFAILAWRVWRRRAAAREPWVFTFEEQPALAVNSLRLS